jgi:hypothetical protein
LQILKLAVPALPHVVSFDSGVKLSLTFTQSASVSHGKTQYIRHELQSDVLRHAPPHLHCPEVSHSPPLGVQSVVPLVPLEDDDDVEDELLDVVEGPRHDLLKMSSEMQVGFTESTSHLSTLVLPSEHTPPAGLQTQSKLPRQHTPSPASPAAEPGDVVPLG